MDDIWQTFQETLFAMQTNRLVEKDPHGFARLMAFPVSLAGLAFFRSWITLLTDTGITAGPGGLAHDVALSGVLVVLALVVNRIAPLLRKNWILAVCWALALGASILAIAASLAGQDYGWVGLALTLPVSCASALFILLWLDLYAALPIVQAALSLSLAMILAEAVNFLLAGMIASYRLGALVALPCLSMACLLCARTHVPQGAGAQPLPPHANLARLIPWNLVLLVAAYQFTGGFCLAATSAPVGLYTGIANVLAAGTVVGCILYFPERVDLASICKSPAVLLVPALLLIPFAGGGHGSFAGASAAFSSSLFGLLIFLVICDIAHVQSIPAVFLFGIEEATTGMGAIGQFLGRHCASLNAIGVSTTAMITMLVALTVIAGLTLFDSEKLAAKWGIHVFGRGKISVDAHHNELLETACRDAAVAHKLTAREQEVLVLLARGRTLDEMCTSLGVARGTVKAHCEHIYTKTGVRSKRELLRLLGVE